MAQLRAEYEEEKDDVSSTHMRAINISSKTTLSNSDIVDRGSNRPKDTPRFHLAPDLYLNLHKTSSELQFYLEGMAGLISERESYFVVDPKDTFLTILNGAHDIAQLHAAWVGIVKRIGLAVKNVDKYDSEYKETDSVNRVQSPISTDPSIIDGVDSALPADERMRYIYARVPHHKVDLTEDALQRFNELHDWQDIYPIPTELRQFHSNEPLRVGQTRSSEFGHTSYKGNGQFVLPPLSTTTLADKGKGREFRRSTKPSAASNSLHMGPSTPWKSSTQFLNPPGSRRNPVPGITQPDGGIEPNVLRGLGSINTGIWGDDGLPANGQLNQSQITQNRNVNPEIGNNYENLRETGGNSPRNNKQSQPSGGGNSPPPNNNFPTGGGGNGGNPFPGGGDYPSPGGGGNPYPGGGGGNNPWHGGGGSPGGGGDPFPGGGPGPPGGGGNPFPGGGGGGGYPDPSLPAGAVIPNDESDLREYIPYGTNVPTIKAELKHENLPSWDGNHETAIEYFWKVQQLASLGGWIPQALGYWLWNSLKPGSKVQVWFATLTGSEQARMRSHYIHYLKGIKELFLGKKWQMQMNVAFESQSFRQPGHDREAPSTFIARRIMYTRMLVAVEEGSPVEVFIIMQKAPISWGPIIVLETVKNTSMLYSRVTEHEAALALAAKQETSNVLTAENVVPVLRRMGYYLDRQRGTIDRRAHLGVTPQGESKWVPEKRAYISELDDKNPDSTSPEDILKEAYQALGVRQRPPPKGGYPYPKNDQVTTKMGRLPPSPCKTCGSKNHWDKECPDWAISQARQERAAMSNEVAEEDAETEIIYQSAFSALVSERLASEQVHLDKLHDQDFESAVLQTFASRGGGRKTSKGDVQVTTPRVTIEEIEDESWAALNKLPKSAHHILEEIESEVVNQIKDPPGISKPPKASMEEVEDEFWQEYYSLPKSFHHVLDDNWSDEELLKESHHAKAQDGVVLTIFMINLQQMPAQSYLNFQVCYEMKNLWQLE